MRAWLPGCGMTVFYFRCITGWKKLYLREPHEVIELVEEGCLLHSIEAVVAKISPHESVILLLHKTIVVLLPCAAA